MNNAVSSETVITEGRAFFSSSTLLLPPIKNQNAAQQGVYFGYPEHSAKLQTISGMNWFTKPLRMSFLRVASFIVKDVNN